MPKKLDEVDRQILALLQQDGRMKRGDIARHVGKSLPIVSERIRRMEEAGIIRRHVTLLSPRKIGLEVMAFVTVQSESSTFYEGIIESAQAEPHILECHAQTGEGSHLLKVHTQNTEQLERLLNRIQSWPGVKNTRTSIVLSSPKDSTALPLDQLDVKGS